MSGMASHELLVELWHDLARSLRGVLKGPKRPSVEHLQVTRKFLKENGRLHPPDEASRKKLEKLRRLYLEAMVKAFERPEPPTPSLLGEARQFLSGMDRYPEQPSRAEGSTAADLLAMKLPFQPNKH